jgi:drug/metabolite transporter (DMT)-like permease
LLLTRSVTVPNFEKAVDLPTSDNPSLGFAAMLLSVLLFSLMDASVKWLGATYPTGQIMFFRCAIALLPILIIIYLRGGICILKTRRAGLHLLRSLLGISAMGFAFYAFSLMPLANAISILHTTPIFMTALSVILLGEVVGVRRWSAVIAGFVGMLFVIRPGAGMIESGSLYMLIAALLISFTTIIIRKLSRSDDPVSITFYFTLAGVAISTPAMLIQGWVTPPPFDLFLLIMVGLFGGMAQYFMTLSYRHVAIAVVAPLKYLTIALGGLIGYLLWQEVPDFTSLLGIGIIVASGLYTLHREMVQSKGNYL